MLKSAAMPPAFVHLILALVVASAPTPVRGEPAPRPPDARGAATGWVDGLVAEAQRHLGSTVCLGGLEATGCRHRLLGLLDEAADFDALAAAVLSGLDAPDAPRELARFRDALRAVLVRTWERRLTGSARLAVEVLETTPDAATLRLGRGRDSVHVVLTLVETPNGPRVANVGVDGADIVHTWRPRIAQLLREGSFEAMIDALQRR